MKNNIYITGIICLTITLVAVLFKVSHMAGANWLLIAGLGSITFVFLPIAYFRLRKSTDDSLLKFVYFAAFTSFSIDFIGALFKILHWPGAGWFMIVGIPLPFVLFLPAYIVYHTKRKLKTDLNFFSVILFMIYLGVFTTLLAMDPSYGANNSFAYSTNSVSGSNNYMIRELDKANSSNLSNGNKKLVEQLEKLKMSLLLENSSKEEGIAVTDGEIDFTQINYLSNLTSLHNLKNQEFQRFNQLFERYCTMLKNNDEDNNVQRLIDEINIYRLPRFKDDIPIIGQMPLIGVLNILTDWQNKILLIEYTRLTKTNVKTDEKTLVATKDVAAL